MAAPARLTSAEYFAIDEASEVRHELVQGQIYAMAGGSAVHARLISQIGGVLFGKLPPGCGTYANDLRVAVQGDTYCYPDHSIVCGEVEVLPDAPPTATNPIVIFEILSPSTQNYDRGLKARLYLRIPSLRSLVLIEQSDPAVDVYERQGDGSWSFREFTGLEAVVPLPAVKAEIALADLYHGIALS